MSLSAMAGAGAVCAGVPTVVPAAVTIALPPATCVVALAVP
jgi:hypothetical protein